MLVRDEELAVDDGWHAAEVEPEVIEMHRNGACHGEAVGVAHGHHEEAVESQQLLFPWAEIMAEEAEEQPTRSWKPNESSLPLLELAVSLEENREKEMVSARR